MYHDLLTIFARPYETVTDLEKASTLCMARLAQSNVNRPKIIYHGGFKPLVYNAQVCFRVASPPCASAFLVHRVTGPQTLSLAREIPEI
jgi:hypothetical protein